MVGDACGSEPWYDSGAMAVDAFDPIGGVGDAPLRVLDRVVLLSEEAASPPLRRLASRSSSSSRQRASRRHFEVSLLAADLEEALPGAAPFPEPVGGVGLLLARVAASFLPIDPPMLLLAVL